MQRLPQEDLKHVLVNTSELWDVVRNKSIFLTGGTGFFGKWLAESFIYINNALNLNASLTILSRDPEKFQTAYPFYKDEPSIDFIKGDILNFRFPTRDYQYIIHAATDADAALNTSNPLLMMDTITEGTRRILDFALDKSVESFLFTSSGAVYGKQPSELTHLKEDQYYSLDINNPHNAYAEGKRLAELYCSIYYSHRKVPVKIARCFAFVGPYLPLDKHFAIGNFILNAIKGEDIIIKGDGSPFRSYLYASDLTIWLWTILLKGINNSPYNVGSDEDYDLKAIAQLISEVNKGISVKVLTPTTPGKQAERYVPDVNKIKETLGVTVHVPLIESIRKTQGFMGKYNVYRACPVCKSNKAEFIHQIEFALFEGHPMDKGYALVQCEKCFFIYADTHVTQDALDIYYKDFSKYEDKNIGTGGGYSKYDKDRLIKTAEFIATVLPDKNARIIDLGCANGGMLKELKLLGYNNLIGLDPSETCVEITREEVGCEAYQMSLFQIGEVLGTFDLVILSHVLEHLLELTGTLTTLNKLVKEDGLVYVECPNAQNYNKVIHAPLQEFNTEHINHFTEVTFENLFGLNGYRKITTGNKTMKIASGQDYHAVYGVFQKVGDNYSYELKPDEQTTGSIKDYIDKSEKIFDQILEKLFQVNSSESVALYGIGQFAFKLIDRLYRHNYHNLIYFDNNSLNIGKSIMGIKILPGSSIVSEFVRTPFIVAITSPIHEEAIRKQIEDQFNQGSLEPPEIIGFQNSLMAQDVY